MSRTNVVLLAIIGLFAACAFGGLFASIGMRSDPAGGLLLGGAAFAAIAWCSISACIDTLREISEREARR